MDGRLHFFPGDDDTAVHMKMNTPGVVITAADKFFVGKENQIVAEHPHLFLEGVQHLDEERVRNLHVELTGKNDADQIGFFSSQRFSGI
ncbi:hypothetical protein D3C75_396420 [compost metagenome]